MQTANFGFLSVNDARLLQLGALAEQFFRDDPGTAKLRQFAELFFKTVDALHALYLGDANILFFNRDEIVLSYREMCGLVDSALAHFSNENVPLWHWYVAADCEQSGYLSFSSLFGQSPTRIGALNAMRLIFEPIKPLSNVERRNFVQSWLYDSADERLKVAALERM